MSHQMPSDHKPENDKISDEPQPHRSSGWLPQDQRVHKEWLGGVIDHVEKNPKELHSVLKEFQGMVEGDSRLFMLFTEMFVQIPSEK